VEPVPELAALLRERATGDVRWRIVECALGERDGTTTLNIMAETEFSSILQPDTTVLGDFSGKNVVREQAEVAMRTLDSLLAEILSDGDPGVMHLKLDTQGYDLSVARGGVNTLARCASLQTEIAFERSYAGMPGYAEAIEAFRALGFVPSAMFPNHVSHYFPRLVELDCYMVARASLLPREELR
jgi:FkbM family methyltransferase